jgi:hypothetical protein
MNADKRGLTITYHGAEAESRLGVYARAFVERFGSGQRWMAAPLGGFVGRVLRGKTDDNFLTLTDNPRRRVVFMTDAAALCEWIGLNGRDILRHIGYGADFINDLLAAQTRFKLVLLPELTMQLATWDNLLDLAGAAYPDWQPQIERCRAVLKTTPYAALEGEAAEVRRFLADTLNVNALFAGDGYTRREGDPLIRLSPEYVILNRPLVDIGPHCLIDFPVARE